jgi:hypothetical protein
VNHAVVDEAAAELNAAAEHIDRAAVDEIRRDVAHAAAARQAVCAISGVEVDNPSAYWHAYDFHSSRNITAVVQQTINHLNRNSHNTSYIPVHVIATPKGSLSGGPDGIDFCRTFI